MEVLQWGRGEEGQKGGKEGLERQGRVDGDCDGGKGGKDAGVFSSVVKIIHVLVAACFSELYIENRKEFGI